MMQLLTPAIVYFTIVFGTGFAFGVLRVLLLVPRVGVRAAEFIEAPFMLAATVLWARWMVRRYPSSPGAQLGRGLTALGFLLLAEIGVGVVGREMSPVEALLDRDPIAGAVYAVLLLLFAAMPYLLSRYRGTPTKPA